MKPFCAMVALIAVTWALSSAASAQQAPDQSASSPTLVRLDGQLKTAAGEARTGSVTMLVSLYAEKDDTTPLWVEQQAITLDAAGRYTIFAGATLPDGVPQEFLAGATAGHWLGVGVQGEAEQFRMMLVTVPYAARAREADTLAGKSIGDFVLTESLTDTVKASLKSQLNGASATSSTGPGTFANAQFAVLFDSTGTGPGAAADSGNLFNTATGVGIGTNAPVYPLSVAGTGTLMNLYSGSSSPAFNIGQSPNVATEFNKRGQFYVDMVNNVFDIDGINQGHGSLPIALNGLNGGSVGIGTTAPSATLTVAGGFPTAHFFSLVNPGITIGQTLNPLVPQNKRAQIYMDTVNNVLRMDALVQGGVSLPVALNAGGGNVGIGTLAPTQKLDVQGNINVSGNINAKYQDVAEWVETSESLENGTVVIIDPLEPNKVKTAPTAYDTRVAGAVSRQPGLVLGDKGDNKALVAQSGRVLIKADAKYGAIKIGDLLVTSPTPGYAMVSKPIKVSGQQMHRPGTLLGKALEALPNGQGEILVLLTLQ